MEKSGEREMDNSELRRILRKRALEARDALSGEERRKGSVLMTERILGHQWFYRSQQFLCFVSFGSEIDTRELIEEAIRQKKQVYVPKVTDASQNREMKFYRLTSLSELTPGYRKIPEPSGFTEEYVYRPWETERAFLLMPGVAFDPDRNRLGYGMGFYDRFLADKEGLWVRSAAVGFQCQMVDSIPAGQRDIRPYQVLLF